MKILFFDIETVPTEQSLQDNGLLESQIRLDEAEIIKKLSLAAATSRILCLAYALEPPLDSPSKSFTEMKQKLSRFLEISDRNAPLRRPQYIGLRSSVHLSAFIINQIKPSREIPFARFHNAPIFDTMHEWSKWGASTSVSIFYPAPGDSIAQREFGRFQSLSLLLRGRLPRSVTIANATWKRCGRSIGG
jgi:hypothetical protein